MRRRTLSVPVDINDELLNISEAAILCKVSEGAMYKRAKRGLMPSHKIGMRVYFSRKELLAYTLQR